jgi:hypothetical protein
LLLPGLLRSRLLLALALQIGSRGRTRLPWRSLQVRLLLQARPLLRSRPQYAGPPRRIVARCRIVADFIAALGDDLSSDILRGMDLAHDALIALSLLR